MLVLTHIITSNNLQNYKNLYYYMRIIQNLVKNKSEVKKIPKHAQYAVNSCKTSGIAYVIIIIPLF